MVREMSELCFFVPSPRRDRRGRPLAMDGLNEIIARERGNLHAAAKAKHEATAYVSYIAARAAHEQHWHTPEGVHPMSAEEVEWLREQILLTAQGVLLAAIVFALMFAACALA